MVCNEAHRFLVAEQLRAIDCKPRAIVLEPAGRNTAPAIALAAHATLAAEEGDPLLLVLPADHVIPDVAAFHSAIEVAGAAARNGALVTFGIVPTTAETGYGYIRRGGLAAGSYRIAEFVEKPELARAQAFLSSGEYYWNSGMFLFRARRYLEELETLRAGHRRGVRQQFCRRGARSGFYAHRPGRIPRLPQRIDRLRGDGKDRRRGGGAARSRLERCRQLDLAACSLRARCTGQCAGWRRNGRGYPRQLYLRPRAGWWRRWVLRDHVVVETKDAVLVAPKDRVQDVKKLVARLKAAGRYEHSLHREVFRPWGSYDSIDIGERFQVKRLMVHPGGVLSLQMHHHRAEHWVVVSGTARITRGEETYLLEENQSTYIPIGVRHRIENPGRIPLHIIEVQSGSYLGEDDIVRLEDRYGRQGTNT